MFCLFLQESCNNEIITTKVIEQIESRDLKFQSYKDAKNYFDNNFDVSLNDWNINYMYGNLNSINYFRIIIKEC